MQKELVEKFKTYLQKSKSKYIKQVMSDLDLKEYEVYGLVEMLKNEGYLFDTVDGKIIKVKPTKNNDVYEIPSNLEKLKLLLISDTHLGNKYDRLDILRYLYDEADKKGIKHILHSGDFTDGRSNRYEQIFELKEPSYEGQVQYCVDKYPKFDGKTYVIQGNHDNWWYKSAGSEIVRSIAKERDDIIYLGPDVADLKIGKLKVRLFHGTNGNSYARSYRLQKYLDSIPQEELPDILQTGHIHQSFYMKQGKTHCFQTSCLQDLTPYERSKGFANDKSVWWVDVYMDDKGKPVKVNQELETFSKKLKR